MCAQVLSIDIFQHIGIEARNVRVVFGITPTHCAKDQTTLPDLVNDSGADELGNGWGAIVCCAGLLVELMGGFDDVDWNRVLGEEEGEEET